MKKYGKFLVGFLLSLIVIIMPVKAKEMTLDELNKEIEIIDKNAIYVYIIGDYAFTSTYNLSLKDIMLASTSIKTEGVTEVNDLKGKIHIDLLIKTDAGLEGDVSPLGDAALAKEATVNIKYINYTLIPDDTPYEPSFKDFEEQHKNILKGYKYDITDDKLYTDNLQVSEPVEKIIETEDGERIKANEVKVTGRLLVNTEVDNTIFPEDEVTGYYLPYVISIKNATDDTVIEAEMKDGTYKKVSKKDFDFKDENGESGVVLLISINPSSENKVRRFYIDLDGDKTAYRKTAYIVDFSGLTFQNSSDDSIEDEISESDATFISTNWGYTKNAKDTYSYDPETQKLTGTIYEQKIKEGVFSTEEAHDFYFLFNITPEKITDDIKVTVKGNNTRVFTKKDFGEDHSLAMLFAVPEKCINNKAGEGKCKVTITIDVDGEDKTEYTDTVYVIDYSDVTYLHSSEKVNFTSKVKAENASYSIAENGKVVGLIENDADGKKYFNVPLQLEELKNGTTVKVTNPKQEETIYKYTGEDKIMLASLPSEQEIPENGKLDLKLEVLDEEDLNKEYVIEVDIDGLDKNDYETTSYTFDYSEISTKKEDYIMQSVDRTFNARSLSFYDFTDENKSYNEYNKDQNRKMGMFYHNNIKKQTYIYSPEGKEYVEHENCNRGICPMNVTAYERDIVFTEPFGDISSYGEWTQAIDKFYASFGIYDLNLVKIVTDGKVAENYENTHADKVKDKEHITYYEATLTEANINSWLSGYQSLTDESGHSDVYDSSESELPKVTIGIDNEGFIRYINTTVKIKNEEITSERKVDILINGVNKTSVSEIDFE